MTALEFAAIAALVTASMTLVDYAHARYSVEMYDHRRDARVDLPRWRRPLYRAAVWSLVQWGSASAGFVVTVTISMWFLPFEAAGLFMGTILGGSRRESRGVEQS